MPQSSEFIEKQKNLLLSERDRLENEIAGLKKYPDYGDLEDDSTQELIDYENNMSVEDRLEKVLIAVKRALKSIEDGTYGQCRSCQGAIEGGRLEAMPYADLCVTCEKKSK